jgi:hypothetical protein
LDKAKDKIRDICKSEPKPLPREDDCDQEWERAYEKCEELIAAGKTKGIAGGYTDLYNCARGLVSERCGGNKVIY